jgi:putative Mg2+ transporter-C (MgtC) family protein
MPLHLGWHEIALRLGLTFCAAFLIGLNRGRRGEAAGLRTTLLVCLAASVSMIQVNLLLDTEGRSPSSFGVMDYMRLPLGILTGMGFIGAGAIMKRGSLVMGVTTAASLWFTTVIGLCLGGGQLGLGVVSLALALFVLMVLKRFENSDRMEHQAVLSVSAGADGVTRGEIEKMINDSPVKAIACAVTYRPAEGTRTFEFIVGSHTPLEGAGPPGFVERLSEDTTLRELRWLPEAVSSSPPKAAHE